MSIAVVVLMSLFFPSLAIREQSVAVKGVIKCGNELAVGVKVALWDDDAGPDFNDLLAEAVTKEDGTFYLAGSETEVLNIDPVLRVYHDCNDIMPGQRRVSIEIPDTYITEGPEAKRVFDVGTLNLEAAIQEDRDVLQLIVNTFGEQARR